MSISWHEPLSGHDDVAHFSMSLLMTLINTEIKNYVTNAESERMGKLTSRIPGSGLLISSLPGLASRMHVESLCEPCNVNVHSQSLAW